MKKLLLKRALSGFMLSACAFPLFAASDTNETSKAETKAEAKDENKFVEEPPPSVTTHTIAVGGKTLNYHATAGYIILKEEQGKPLIKEPGQKPPPETKPEKNPESEPTKTKDGLKEKAKIFFVAYV